MHKVFSGRCSQAELDNHGPSPYPYPFAMRAQDPSLKRTRDSNRHGVVQQKATHSGPTPLRLGEHEDQRYEG